MWYEGNVIFYTVNTIFYYNDYVEYSYEMFPFRIVLRVQLWIEKIYMTILSGEIT